MFQMLFTKINLSSDKSEQWRRSWGVVLVSVPQLQIGFNKSWKLCINLSSQRCLKPNLNLVSNFIPLGLWQLNMLFGDGFRSKTFFQNQDILDDKLMGHCLIRYLNERRQMTWYDIQMRLLLEAVIATNS